MFMLDAVRDTAAWTTDVIYAVRALIEETAATIREKAPKIYSRELAEIIFVQPYCRIANLVAADIAKRQTAAVYLGALADLGLLEERKVGREKIFVNRRFIDILSRK
jgi:Fic family protein